MAANLADDNFTFSWIKNDRIPIQISLKFVPRIPIDNKPALVQVMALAPNRRQAITWTKLAQFTDIYAALGGDELILLNAVHSVWSFLAPTCRLPVSHQLTGPTL